MAVLAVPGAVLGAFLSGNLSAESFKLYFGIVLAIIGLYILYKNSILKDAKKRNRIRSIYALAAMAGAAFAAGVISSLFGVGGGVIFVPTMLLILGMTMLRAAPTSQFILMITSVVGVITHVLLGHPDYLYAVALSAGAFGGAQIGARISDHARENILQKLLGMALLLAAAKLVSDWLGSR